MEKRTKESSKRINSLILLIAFTAIMLIVSTYAWFTSQKDITLSNLRGTVEVVENMEISLDAKTWHQEIDLSEANVFENAQLSRDDAEGLTVTNLQAIIPDELLPVSGIGETGSATMPLYKGTPTSTSLNGVSVCSEPTDNGYFAFDIYIKNTSEDGEDDVLQLNLNSAVQVLLDENGTILPGLTNTVITKNVTLPDGNVVQRSYYGDAASGLQNTVRVGLALYNKTTTSTATQTEILNATGAADSTIENVAIWEPNSNDHVEYIVENNNKLIYLPEGASEYSKNEFEIDDAVDTYAVIDDAIGNDIENVYNMSDPLLAKQVTFQTTKRSESNYRIYSSTGKPLDIKDISGNNFTITSNTVSKLRVYVWLEGQDVDCINIASQGGGIEVDLGLTKDGEIGEVLADEQVSE